MNITGNMPANLNNNMVDKSKLTTDSFMTMLLAQLKSQDPLKPFDASTMMQQIAQLTGLSASQKLTESVEAMQANTGISQVLSASHLVGKGVQIDTNKMHLNAGQSTDGAVLIPRGIEKIEIAISDVNGNKVRTLNLNAPSEGLLDFKWDGLDENGKALESGFYTMAATASLQGEALNLPTTALYKVNSVALDRAGKGVILNVDDLGGVSMDDVVKIL